MSEPPPHEKLQVFPAALSLLCPGLGQLLQGRISTFFAHFVFFVIIALVPIAIIFDWRSEILRHQPGLPGSALGLVLILAPYCIFPFLLAFFSNLDAAVWKPGEDSRFKKTIRKVFCYGVIFNLALFTLFWVGNSGALGAARRMQCSSNLKQIGLALHTYLARYGSLPPAFTVDENGKPLHSWRVLILPFMEHKELYNEIRLDEPWNSEHNRQFHARKIGTYECPSGGVIGWFGNEFPGLRNEKNCFYSVIIGDETPFPATQTVSFKDIKDGTDNTIFVVERMVPICWMDPNHEIPYETALEGVNKNLYGIGSAHSGGAMVLWCAGLPSFIPNGIDPEVWKGYLTISGGEDVHGPY